MGLNKLKYESFVTGDVQNFGGRYVYFGSVMVWFEAQIQVKLAWMHELNWCAGSDSDYVSDQNFTKLIIEY